MSLRIDSFFFLMLRPRTRSTLFPYTTLFRSENDAKERDRAHENGGERRYFVGQSPGRLVPFGSNFSGKRGDEGGGEGAFGKQIAQQIRQTKGHQKGIEIFSRTKEPGENLLPNQPKNTAR